jgi:hypothetical protein
MKRISELLSETNIRVFLFRKPIFLVGALTFVGASTLGIYALFTISTGNFHEVVKGQSYRSAQLNNTI